MIISARDEEIFKVSDQNFINIKKKLLEQKHPIILQIAAHFCVYSDLCLLSVQWENNRMKMDVN